MSRRQRGFLVLIAVLCLSCVAIPTMGWLFRGPLVRMLVGDSCTPVVPPQLDMVELIALRRKTTAYAFNEEQPLLLTDREMSWVLTEQYRIPAEVSTDSGSVVTLRKPVAMEGGGCGDLDFVGRIRVEEGVLRVWPDNLRFGNWPMPLLPGSSFEVDPMDLGAEGPAAEKLIHAIASLEVHNGTFRLMLSDLKVLP